MDPNKRYAELWCAHMQLHPAALSMLPVQYIAPPCSLALRDRTATRVIQACWVSCTHTDTTRPVSSQCILRVGLTRHDICSVTLQDGHAPHRAVPRRRQRPDAERLAGGAPAGARRWRKNPLWS